MFLSESKTCGYPSYFLIYAFLLPADVAPCCRVVWYLWFLSWNLTTFSVDCPDPIQNVRIPTQENVYRYFFFTADSILLTWLFARQKTMFLFTHSCNVHALLFKLGQFFMQIIPYQYQPKDGQQQSTFTVPKTTSCTELYALPKTKQNAVEGPACSVGIIPSNWSAGRRAKRPGSVTYVGFPCV